MAQHLTLQQIMDYPVGTGTADLVKLISANRPSTWVRANQGAAPVGTVAYVSAMGAMRRGVVVKVTKTKLHVALTTQGAVDSARQYEEHVGAARGSQPIRVQIVVCEPETAFIAPKPEPVQDEASEIAQAQTDQVEGWLAAHRAKGTPRTQWSPVEDARQADHAEALTLNSHAGKVISMNKDEATKTHPSPGSFNDLSNPANRPGYVAPVTEVKTAPATRETTGSAVVQLLEKVWSRIRENHPELPAVVIVTGAGLGFGGGKWGHFRANGWTAKVAEEGVATSTSLHEMFMAGETLAKGARQVLQTMLHEGAHTLARVREIQETSRQGRWHNAKFKTLAEEMGLEHKNSQADKSIGFSFVTLTEDTLAEYADLLDELNREIHLMVRLPGFLATKGQDGDEGGENMGKAPKGPAVPNSNNIKCVCLCEEPRIIRASRKVLEGARIMCEDCDAPFKDRG